MKSLESNRDRAVVLSALMRVKLSIVCIAFFEAKRTCLQNIRMSTGCVCCCNHGFSTLFSLVCKCLHLSACRHPSRVCIVCSTLKGCRHADVHPFEGAMWLMFQFLTKDNLSPTIALVCACGVVSFYLSHLALRCPIWLKKLKRLSVEFCLSGLKMDGFEPDMVQRRVLS